MVRGLQEELRGFKAKYVELGNEIIQVPLNIPTDQVTKIIFKSEKLNCIDCFKNITFVPL